MPPQFTPQQRAAIRKIVTTMIAGLVIAVGAMQVQLNTLNDRVTALETPTTSPSPSVTPSPTATPSPSPTTTSSPSPSGSPSPTPVPLPGPEPVGPGGGVFSVVCTIDHQAPDDPVVYPFRPGAAHMHDFFGATGVNSDPASLVSSGTTCEHPSDLAAYWAPALVSPSGQVVLPRNVISYYQAGVPVRAMPAGLVMIADIGKDPDTGFGCTNNSAVQATPDLSCPSGSVRMHVHFPVWWDGVNLDSPNHRDHMSYTRDATHQVRIVELHIHVFYGLSDTHGYHLALNTDGTTPQVHADFVNHWDQAVLENIIRTCINAGVDCKGDNGAGL